jgi:hypothetical protein
MASTQASFLMTGAVNLMVLTIRKFVVLVN